MLSKEEEIKKYERWYKSLEEGSYLKMIFKNLNGYVEKQIKADLGFAILDNIEIAYQDMAKANTRADNAEKELKKYKEDFSFKASKIGRKVLKLRKQVKTRIADYKEEKRIADRLWKEALEMRLEMFKAKNEAKRLQAEVKRQFGVIAKNNLTIIKLRYKQ